MKYLMLILVLMISSFSFASVKWQSLVEMRKSLSASQIKAFEKAHHLKLKKFSDQSRDAFFSKLYYSSAPAESLRQISGVISADSIARVESTSLKPSEGPFKYSTDPLMSYQWALENKGIQYSIDIDDIRSLKKTGRPGFDIGFSLKESTERGLLKTPVVAVIDSGVDIGHPDLKNEIFLNEVECVSGQPALNPKEDKDSNGYKGDCAGWNFTGTSTDGNARMTDDVGHGTHIAGIIAAESNNNLGISGVSSKIKILPVKVLTKQGNQAIGLTDRIAKGILYAIDRKVDVINLSLGWPILMDKKYLREAVRKAFESGIVVVAAAGNNNHNLPIYPCAYLEVLCVGAADPNGEVSDFSNFGSHVDVLAPGQQIIGTFPTAMTPQAFSIQSYEIKSGTSQAAPYVSALAALIKSQNPQLGPQEIIARIKASSASRKANKPTQYGMISYDLALATGNESLSMIPLLKTSPLLDLNEKNCWTHDVVISETLGSLRDSDISLKLKNASSDQLQFTLKPDAGNQILNISGCLKDLDQDSEEILQMKIQGKDYFKNLLFVRSPDHLDLKTVSLPENIPGLTELALQTAYYNPESEERIYLAQKADRENTLLLLFKLSREQSKTLDQVIPVEKTNQILSTDISDADQDGDLDIRAIFVSVVNEKKRVFEQSFDISSGKPLYPANEIAAEGFIPAWSGVEKFKITQNGQTQFAPILIGSGQLPNGDQPKSSLERKDTSIKARVFFYVLSKSATETAATWKLKSLDRADINKSLRNLLKLTGGEDVRPLSVLKADSMDQIKVLYSIGFDFQRRLARIVWDMKNPASPAIAGISWLSTDSPLDGMSKSLSISLDGSPNETVFTGAFQSLKWTVMNLNPASANLQSMTLAQTEPTENMNLLVGSMHDGDQKYHWVQTVSQILLFSGNSDQVKMSSRSFAVSSFLPGELFLDRGYPIRVGKKPSLFVDASQVFSQRFFVMQGDQQSVQMPVRYQFSLPRGCGLMNPLTPVQGNSEIVLRCLENGKNLIKSFRLK